MIEDLSVEDRATALVCWASRWDDIHAQLSSGPGRMTDDIAEAALVAAVVPLAHPLLGRDTLYDLIRDLRDAVSQQSAYQHGGWYPEDWDEKYGRVTDEQAEQMLEDDINAALWPLLSAQSFSCHECKRVRPDVTTWQPVVYGLRCDDHRLLLASQVDRFGVGLVAS
jgi:hypothetical protein